MFCNFAAAATLASAGALDDECSFARTAAKQQDVFGRQDSDTVSTAVSTASGSRGSDGGLDKGFMADSEPMLCTESERTSLLEATSSGALEAEVAATDLASAKAPLSFEAAYDVQPDRILGTGASGAVFQAVCRETGRICAIKRYAKATLHPKNLRNVQREVEVHGSLSHPNVVDLLEVYETEDAVYMVMEVLEGGELFDKLQGKERILEEEAADLAVQLLRGLEYLHAQGIVHRDLKLENLMFEKPQSHDIKIIDFGFAARLGTDRNLPVCGTVQYVAPEVASRRSWDEKCDLWSLGSVMYAVLTQRALFGGGDRRIRSRNRTGQIDWSRRFFELSADAQDFLRGLLSVHPEKRPSASQALSHPWLRQALAARPQEPPRLPKELSITTLVADQDSALRAQLPGGDEKAQQEARAGRRGSGPDRRLAGCLAACVPNCQADSQGRLFGAMCLLMRKKWRRS